MFGPLRPNGEAPRARVAPLNPPDPMRVAALPAFREARFVITPTMPLGIRTKVYEAYKARESVDTLERTIVDYYDSQPALLDALVDCLCADSAMDGREDVLRQTLKAHKDHYDAMTVYPLLPIVEGITVRATDTIFPGVKPFKMARKLRDLTPKRSRIGIRNVAALSTLIAFAESHLYKSFNWDNEAERREAMEL